MSVVVTEESWFSRIGGAFKGIIVGILLAVISVPLLFWNEGRAVKTAKGLKEGAGAVVKLESDDVLPENEGKFVHVVGTAATDETLVDEDFGVQFNGIFLTRKAEMYQWVEKKSTKSKKKLGGGKRTETTYSYEKDWEGSLVNASDFHESGGHSNPESMRFTSLSKQASDVRLGGFRLSGSLVSQISAPQGLEIEPENVDEEIRQNIKVVEENGASVAYFRPGGQYDNQPRIGDIRVSFTATPNSQVSVMSKQSSDSFQPYVTQFDTQLNMLSMGEVAPEQMIAAAEAANAQMTWILRAVGSGMMFFGFLMMMKPLSVLADVVPLFGSIVGAGTGIVAFLLAAAGSLVTISVAWIFYRPVLGIGLLALAAVALFFLFKRTRGAKKYAADELEILPPLA
ncbi:MAG: TMEM43 family protein [Pirellulaceae bacterium]